MTQKPTYHRYLPWPCDRPGPWCGVWLESVGRRGCSQKGPWHTGDFYCLHLLNKGQLHYQVAGVTDTLVGPGELFAMWPDTTHRMAPANPDHADAIDMDWLRLRGPLARSFMHCFGCSEQEPVLKAAQPEKLKRQLRQLQQLAINYTDRADMQAMALLHEIALSCGYRGQERPENRPLAIRLREAMEAHLDSGMNVADYAKSFKVSRSTLFKSCQQHFGISPVKLLNEIRLAKACHLLHHSTLSMAEIAKACGDENLNHFSRRFKAQYGVSPSTYRRQA